MLTVADISSPRICRRRLGFLLGIFVILAPGFLLMLHTVTATGFTVVALVELILFSVLFALVVYGGLLALTGYCLLRRGGDPLRISKTLETATPPKISSRTAIVMPIYNEDVGRVFQRLHIVYESLSKTGRLADFDFFVLSDSNDPNHWIAEE